MNKLFLTLTVAGIASGSAVAQAGSDSCATEKVDASSCTVEKVADSGCCPSEKVALSESDALQMAKGGATESDVKAGYGLGHKVPDFTRTTASGDEYTLSSTAGNPTVLVFYNQQCPFVVEVNDRLSDFTKTYKEKGVSVWAIDSGVNNSKEEIAKQDEAMAFPILIDHSSELAVKFEATRTPEVFVLDKDGVVQYHGMFDTGQNVDADGNRKSYTKDAVDALLAGKDIEVTTTKAFGCTIKLNPDAKKVAAQPKSNWKAEKAEVKDVFDSAAKNEKGLIAY